MILENNGVKGLKSDLAYLDKVTEVLGFVRWQWEYNRATYDFKFEDQTGEYFLRLNARAIEGKLESPDTVLELQDAYLGKATFPHGLDYVSPVPDQIVQASKNKLAALQQQLS